MSTDQLQLYKILNELGLMVTSEINLDNLFRVIMDQTNLIMNTERCSVFMYDSKSDELWTLGSTDLGKNEVRIPADHGIAGWVYRYKLPQIINDPYNDSRFFPEVDHTTGFRTRNLLCIPLINRKLECIGTLQTLNKKNGDFADQDLQVLTSIASYVTIALKNAKLYDDLKALDKARERVINHLSHELKTPLAVIYGALSRIRNRLTEMDISDLDKTVDRGARNVRRLIDLQEKIDDILVRDPEEVLGENKRIVDLIQSAADLVEEAKEANYQEYDGFIQSILDRLNTVMSPLGIKPEKVDVKEFLEPLCERAMVATDFRQIMISGSFEKQCKIFMDRHVLTKVCDGLLRNAIENTPDQGLVEVTAIRNQGTVEVSFRDYGTGITPQNQNLIFGGFFHTQDTAKYSSKKPYVFNAGGSGSDLLRIKAFSERFGFTIAFESTRCRFRPADDDVCPGAIDACRFVQSADECFAAGGSTFTLRFPVFLGKT